MKLRKYLSYRGISSKEFAMRLDVSLGAVRKWRTGERIPRPHIVSRIARATRGSVSPKDWYN